MADGDIISGRVVSGIGTVAHTDANFTEVVTYTVPVVTNGIWKVRLTWWGGLPGTGQYSVVELVGTVAVDAGTAAVTAYGDPTVLNSVLGDAAYDVKIAITSSPTLQLLAKAENGYRSFGFLELFGGEVDMSP